MNLRSIVLPAVLTSAAFASLAMAMSAQAQTARGARTTTVQPVQTKVGPVTNADSTTTAATVPVGFTTTAVTPATDANTPSSQVLSVPFYQPAAYAAAVTSVDSATQFSSSSASWTASQFAQTGAPYLVHFKSGSSVGRYFLISANTTNQLTVVPRGYSLTTTVAASDTFEIVPANTFGTLFGTTSVPLQTGTTSDVADDIYLWNGSGFSVYYHNGSIWKLSGSLANQNNTVIYPDEGLFLVRRATTSLSLNFVGTVPSVTERSDVFGPASTFLANRFPVDTTLTAVGFQNLPSWQTGTTSDVADNVYIWNGSSWVVYYYNGTNWKASGILGSQDSKIIPTGSAVFVVRKSTATGTNGTLAQVLPYTL